MARRKKKRSFFILKFFLFLIVLSGFIYLYGSYIEPKNIQSHEYKIKTDKITDNFDGFKILHLSDIHYGRDFGLSDLKSLVKMVNEFEADIVVITGDLIDKDTKISTSSASNIGQELSKIKANSGKYIISGDDDMKFDEWDNIISSGGFMNINNNYDTIYNKGYESLLVAGVSSKADKESIVNKNQKTENYLNSFEKDGPIYKILLVHEPDYIDELENNPYDLVLAGHSHGGIVNIPFVGPIWKFEGAKKYYSDHYNNNFDLYVSNGIGLTKINFRLFNSPSFNVYRLIEK